MRRGIAAFVRRRGARWLHADRRATVWQKRRNSVGAPCWSCVCGCAPAGCCCSASLLSSCLMLLAFSVLLVAQPSVLALCDRLRRVLVSLARARCRHLVRAWCGFGVGGAARVVGGSAFGLARRAAGRQRVSLRLGCSLRWSPGSRAGVCFASVCSTRSQRFSLASRKCRRNGRRRDARGSIAQWQSVSLVN